MNDYPEKIIQTIHKLLELSKHNPSQEEAQSAAMKAQELLAKYHIDMKEVEGIDTDTIEQIDEIKVPLSAKKWKYRLAEIVANNFRCKHFYMGRGTLVFYGHRTDAEIAAETFKYLFIVGDRLAGRAVDKVFGETGTSVSVYNSFVTGFCKGIEEVLSEQCKALMIITPEDVKTSYAERSKSFGTMHNSSVQVGYNRHCAEVFMNGVTEGRNAIGRKQIER